MGVFSIKSDGWSRWLTLRESNRATLSLGLKATNHVAAQRDIFSKSAFRVSAATSGLSTIIQRLVSSAKRRMLVPLSVPMSFM